MAKAKILIVEDNTIAALDLKRSLQRLDFEITQVVDSYEGAMESIERNIPDLVMMDIYLEKEKSGIEIAKDINGKRNIPVLYLSAYSDDETMQKAFETNPVGYLVKPYKTEELKTTISLALYKIERLEDKNIEYDHTHIGCGYYFDTKNKKLYYKNKFIKLGHKEKKLLDILTKAEGKLVSHKHLEYHLWTDDVPSHSSLRTLIYRLKTKLGCNMIEASYANGYKLLSKK